MSADHLPADPGLGAAARAAGLIAVAEDLAGEFSLRPLLERILRRCTELLGCHAGSICSVDEAAGTYRKEADIGVACQSGRVFPLTEGMTGAVVAHRAPVWFTRYDEVHGGHVAAEERATLRGVIGVPLEWRGRVIGACIVFSRDERRVFGPDDAELLELFARHAAIALATARMHEAAEERARAEATTAERDRLLGEGAELDELLRIGNKVNSVTRTMGMALTSCTPPAKGSPLFELGDDEMEMGVGIHGEPGRRREKLVSANEIVDELLEAVVSDLPFGRGDDVALMVNGLGGTPVSELYLLYGYAHEQLAQRGINVRRNYVGNYCTSLDMAGTSITLSRLDDEITGLLAAPAEIAIRTF